jgi:hypothetical protein
VLLSSCAFDGVRLGSALDHLDSPLRRALMAAVDPSLDVHDVGEAAGVRPWVSAGGTESGLHVDCTRAVPRTRDGGSHVGQLAPTPGIHAVARTYQQDEWRGADVVLWTQNSGVVLMSYCGRALSRGQIRTMCTARSRARSICSSGLPMRPTGSILSSSLLTASPTMPSL